MAFYFNFFAMPHYNIIVLKCALDIHSLKRFFNFKLSFSYNTTQTRGLVVFFFILSGLDTSISYIEMHMYVL